MKAIKDLSGLELLGYSFIALLVSVPVIGALTDSAPDNTNVAATTPTVQGMNEIDALVSCTNMVRDQAKGYPVSSGDLGTYAYAVSDKGYGEMIMKVTIKNGFNADIPYTASCLYNPDTTLEASKIEYGHTW